MLTLDKKPSELKSSPIACRARGPAIIIALIVETNNKQSIIPTTAAPFAPNIFVAVIYPISILPSSSAIGEVYTKASFSSK